MTESREKILHLYKTLKTFLESLEPKLGLVKNKKQHQKEDADKDRDHMDIDDERNLNLEQMPKTFTKGQSLNKNKLNMFEVK